MESLERDVLPQIIKQLNNNLIIILIGARQVGKTFILRLIKQYLETIFPKSKILYLNLENEDTVLKLSDYPNFINFLKTQGINSSDKVFVLLDEFQRMPRPTKLLKLLYDEHSNIKIVATGSSSLDIYRKMREESMTGRKRIFSVCGLSFHEFLRFRYPQLLPIWERVVAQNIDPKTSLADFSIPADKFIVWGGYPRTALAPSAQEQQEELKEIYNSYIQKDVAGLLHLEDTVGYNKLINILASQIGNLLNINELTNTLNIGRSTIEHYLFVLENTFIISVLPPYHTNKRKEITKMPKIYFMDTGLRNFSQKNFNELEFRPDKDRLAENMVFLELFKNLEIEYSLYFWRTPQGTEVDFILMKNQNPIPVEVKYQSINKPLVPSGMKAFINIYHPQKGFVITKDFSFTIQYANCQITFLPIFLTSKILKEL